MYILLKIVVLIVFFVFEGLGIYFLCPFFVFNCKTLGSAVFIGKIEEGGAKTPTIYHFLPLWSAGYLDCFGMCIGHCPLPLLSLSYMGYLCCGSLSLLSCIAFIALLLLIWAYLGFVRSFCCFAAPWNIEQGTIKKSYVSFMGLLK